MISNTIKTYNDSYLFKTAKLQKNSSDKNASAAISDFIINAQRIDTSHPSFNGILEEIKRQQRNSIIYSALFMPNIKLCIGNSELPRAFKVIECKDLKSSDRVPTVFIDVTGLIEYKNGYFSCKKIDVLTTYLFDALIYVLYRNYNTKLLNDNTVIMNAAQCYVNMFLYIIDYTRAIGFAANKNKIGYIVAMFFLTNMMGKPFDQYTMSIAAKIAEVDKADINAYNLFIEDGMMDNISTLVEGIVSTFRIQGFGLYDFISKWIYKFGTGTQYATELLTSFLVLMNNAYSGCYIVGQRQIESVCERPMVNLVRELDKVAGSCINTRAYVKESVNTDIHDKATLELAKSVQLREDASRYLSIDESDFHVKDNSKAIAESVIRFCKDARMENKVAPFAEKAIITGVTSAMNSCMDAIKENDVDFCDYELGTITEAAKAFKGNFENDSRYHIETAIEKDSQILREAVKKSGCDKEVAQLASKIISEYREARQYI